jgi:flagellar hook assembly protein FlgD
MQGHIVSRIYQGPWMAGHHVITWSGKNDMGSLVTPGKYTVVVQANGQTTSGIINFPDF